MSNDPSLILHAVAERRDVVGIVLGIERRRVIENRIAAANAGLAIVEGIPGEPESRRQVVVVGISDHVAERVAAAVPGRLLVAVVEQAGQRVLEDLGADAGLVRREIESLVAIQLVREQPVRLVADSEVQRQARADPPGIAEIPSGLRAAPLLQLAAVLGEKREAAQQKIGAVETFVIAESCGVAVELELARSYGTACCC